MGSRRKIGGADEEEEEEEDIREGYKSDVDNYNTNDNDEGDNGKELGSRTWAVECE